MVDVGVVRRGKVCMVDVGTCTCMVRGYMVQLGSVGKLQAVVRDVLVVMVCNIQCSTPLKSFQIGFSIITFEPFKLWSWESNFHI